MTLAEIIAEGERLEAAYCTAPSKTESQHDLNDFYHEYGPRLLAVARAAVWVADDMRYRAPEQAAGLYRTVWLERLDAAAGEVPR